MHFGVTFFDANDYARFFGALALLMRTLRGQNPNFLLVIDEVDLWSDSKNIDPNLGHILRYGRHYGCSWIANCRADVHTNRDVRMNAAEILLFRQGMLSPELSKMVAAVTNSHATKIAQLTRHGPDEPKNAVEGTHFIALPEPFDEWLPTWQALATDA